MRFWRVKRIIEELFDVQADSREAALADAENPHTVTLKSETAKPIDASAKKRAKATRRRRLKPRE